MLATEANNPDRLNPDRAERCGAMGGRHAGERPGPGRARWGASAPCAARSSAPTTAGSAPAIRARWPRPRPQGDGPAPAGYGPGHSAHYGPGHGARLVGRTTLRGALNIIAHTILLPQADAEYRQDFEQRFNTIPLFADHQPRQSLQSALHRLLHGSGPAKEKLPWRRSIASSGKPTGSGARFFVLSGGGRWSAKTRARRVGTCREPAIASS